MILLGPGLVVQPGNPTRTSYDFDGWYTEASCVTAWSFTTNTITAPRTLYAKWNRFYTITYLMGSATGGSLPIAQKKYPGLPISLASNSGGLSLAGHVFVRWNTTANYSGTNYDPGYSYTSDTDITLYPCFINTGGIASVSITAISGQNGGGGYAVQIRTITLPNNLQLNLGSFSNYLCQLTGSSQVNLSSAITAGTYFVFNGAESCTSTVIRYFRFFDSAGTLIKDFTFTIPNTTNFVSSGASDGDGYYRFYFNGTTVSYEIVH